MRCPCCHTKMEKTELFCHDARWWKCRECHHWYLAIRAKEQQAFENRPFVRTKADTRWLEMLKLQPELRATWLANHMSSVRSAIDVGAGTGNLLRLMDRVPVRVAVDYAVGRYPRWGDDKKIEWHIARWEDLRLRRRRFDLVMAWHSLEHTHDVGGAISKMIWVCAPGGFVALEVPVCSKLTTRRYRGHVHRFSQQSLLCLIGHRMQGTNLVSLTPGFLPFSTRVLLQKHGSRQEETA